MSATVEIANAKRRVHTPTILQQESTECGAASLAIVLAHHGRWVPLEELRVTCGVSRDGSRASNIVRAARAYGLEAQGLRIEPGDLPSIELPAIAHWEFGHFLVIEGFDRKGVHLNDPRSGPIDVTWEEFDGAFTGVVVTLRPSDGFTAAGSPPSVVAGLAERFATGRRALILCLLAGLGLLVPGLLVPAGVRIFVNQYLAAGNRHWLWLLVIGLSLAAVAQFAFTWLQQRTLLLLSERLSLSMSSRFFEHVLRLPLSFFGQRYAGSIVSKIQSNDQLAAMLSSELSASLLALLTSALYVVLMFVYDWQLTLVAIAFAACNVLALQAGARKRQDIGRKLVADNGRLIATAVGGLENIETLKATSEEASFFARWAGEHAKIVNATQSLGASTSLLASTPFLLASLNLAVLLGYGGSQVMSGRISLGTLAAFQLLTAGFNAPLARLVGFGDMLVQVAGTLASVDDVLRHPIDPELAPRATVAPSRLSGALELRDVTFGYSPLEPPLIEGLSFSLAPGQRIAVVGASGSGRSTISRLAVGLLHPWSGEVLLDGVPRETLSRASLAATLAFVDQDIRLFEGSIRDNITLWDATIGEEAVVRAARDAAIHDDIVARPGGFERHLEEGGRDWSGGQRQRIEIARALAGDPALLVLDEATSALDPLIEYEIDRNLRARGCACLIVAHRLSTIRDSDEILVLEAGAVVERGTHDELVRLGARYVDLVGDAA